MLANKEVFQQIQYADLTKSWRKVLQDKVFADLIFVFFMPYIVSLHTSALSLPPPNVLTVLAAPHPLSAPLRLLILALTHILCNYCFFLRARTRSDDFSLINECDDCRWLQLNNIKFLSHPKSPVGDSRWSRREDVKLLSSMTNMDVLLMNTEFRGEKRKKGKD